MNTVADIVERLKRELEMIDTSTLFADATLIDAVSDAYLWATDMHPFPRTEKAYYTTSTTDYYYDQPGIFKQDSIFLLVIDDEPYYPTNYEDYLKFKRDNPNKTDDLLFAMFGDQIFIFPTVAAGLEMVIWGLVQPDPLTQTTDTTIFSYSESVGNEGIMRKALSDLLPAGTRKNEELAKATSIISGLWSRIKARQARFQRKDSVMFDVPNLFPGGNLASSPGNFGGR